LRMLYESTTVLFARVLRNAHARTHRCSSAVISVLLGQLVSVCLCGTAVASSVLVSHGVATPAGVCLNASAHTPRLRAAQSFTNYLLLAIVYTTWLSCRQGDANLMTVLVSRGWRYACVALLDVLANYLVVRAFQYTNLTSVQVCSYINTHGHDVYRYSTASPYRACCCYPG
jgi:solute carrier family 35 protein F1/2